MVYIINSLAEIKKFKEERCWKSSMEEFNVGTRKDIEQWREQKIFTVLVFLVKSKDLNIQQQAKFGQFARL